MVLGQNNKLNCHLHIDRFFLGHECHAGVPLLLSREPKLVWISGQILKQHFNEKYYTCKRNDSMWCPLYWTQILSVVYFDFRGFAKLASKYIIEILLCELGFLLSEN